MFCCSLLLLLFFFLPDKELPFYSAGEPLHDHGLYLHDPSPFNGPFFMTPQPSESQKVVTLPLFPPPLLISDKSLTKELYASK